MTAAQASSSTSTLVRAIHQQYTTSQATPLSNQTRCEAARSFPRLGAGSGRYFTLWPGPLYRRLSDSVRLIAVLRGAHRPELAAWLWHQVSPKPSPTPSPSRWSAPTVSTSFPSAGKAPPIRMADYSELATHVARTQSGCNLKRGMTSKLSDRQNQSAVRRRLRIAPRGLCRQACGLWFQAAKSFSSGVRIPQGASDCPNR